MAASDHLAPEQLKLFLPQESAQDVGMHRMNADHNMAFAQQATQRKQDWETQHQGRHSLGGMLRGALSRTNGSSVPWNQQR